MGNKLYPAEKCSSCEIATGNRMLACFRKKDSIRFCAPCQTSRNRNSTKLFKLKGVL